MKKQKNLAEEFAKNEYRDYIIYRELRKIETNPDFKALLQELIEDEWRDYNFWLGFSSKKKFFVNPLAIFVLKTARRILGLNFIAKLIELHERGAIDKYREFQKTASPEASLAVEKIIEHEMRHEKEMINRIKEEQVEFTGSIILGLNDGLIELSGALVGFSFALANHTLVALIGFITGVAASLSMASSAYMQARHEEGKDPLKSSLYTGVSYFIVVIFLVLPFALIANLFFALLLMFFIVLFIIASISFYTSVLFHRSFKKQFLEMLIFSLGVAAIAFVIGSLLRLFLDIKV